MPVRVGDHKRVPAVGHERGTEILRIFFASKVKVRSAKDCLRMKPKQDKDDVYGIVRRRSLTYQRIFCEKRKTRGKRDVEPAAVVDALVMVSPLRKR